MLIISYRNNPNLWQQKWWAWSPSFSTENQQSETSQVFQFSLLTYWVLYLYCILFFPSASLISMIHWHNRTLEGQIQKLNNELADTAQACLAMRKQLPSSTHQTELSISPPPATIPQPKPNSSQQVDTCVFHYIHLVGEILVYTVSLLEILNFWWTNSKSHENLAVDYIEMCCIFICVSSPTSSLTGSLHSLLCLLLYCEISG